MFDLESAIQHCQEVAEFSDRECMYERFYGEIEMKRKCAEEHRQLAEWLKELKNIYGFIEKYPSEDAIYIGDIKDILKGEI